MAKFYGIDMGVEILSRRDKHPPKRDFFEAIADALAEGFQVTMKRHSSPLGDGVMLDVIDTRTRTGDGYHVSRWAETNPDRLVVLIDGAVDYLRRRREVLAANSAHYQQWQHYFFQSYSAPLAEALTQSRDKAEKRTARLKHLRDALNTVEPGKQVAAVEPAAAETVEVRDFSGGLRTVSVSPDWTIIDDPETEELPTEELPTETMPPCVGHAYQLRDGSPFVINDADTAALWHADGRHTSDPLRDLVVDHGQCG